jgi:hypothetical protein
MGPEGSGRRSWGELRAELTVWPPAPGAGGANKLPAVASPKRDPWRVGVGARVGAQPAVGDGAGITRPRLGAAAERSSGAPGQLVREREVLLEDSVGAAGEELHSKIALERVCMVLEHGPVEVRG